MKTIQWDNTDTKIQNGKGPSGLTYKIVRNNGDFLGCEWSVSVSPSQSDMDGETFDTDFEARQACEEYDVDKWVWSEINTILGTRANNSVELLEQLKTPVQ
jgi:hypothetical protein